MFASHFPLIEPSNFVRMLEKLHPANAASALLLLSHVSRGLGDLNRTNTRKPLESLGHVAKLLREARISW